METPRESTTSPVRMTLHGAARHYGVSVARLRAAVRARNLRVTRTGRIEWVTVDDIDRLLCLEQPSVSAAAAAASSATAPTRFSAAL